MTPIRELMPRIKEMIIVGNRIYERCGICGKLVQVNKFLLGSFHLCLSDEDIAEEEPEWPGAARTKEKRNEHDQAM